jgi:carbamate kinase
MREATKPIGNVLTDPEADALRARGVGVGRDGRGRWRRLAPSPTPRDLVEWDAIVRLVGDGKVVIAGGGGGPPVYRDAQGRWEGVDAVVDKDRVAAIIGARLSADVLLMLTDVEAVYERWGTDDARPIPRLDRAGAEALLAGAALGAGSMRPKVEAAVAFLGAGGRRAIIARLRDGVAALRGETGTTISQDVRGEQP